MSRAVTRDEQDVVELVHRLALAIDDADFDAVEALATGIEFAIDDHPAVVGAPAFRQVLERGLMLHDGSPACLHVIADLHVTVDAEAGTAECRSAVSVLQATADFPLQVVLAGRYHDRFARADTGGWRFTSRHLRVALRGDTSRHTNHRRV